MDGLGLAALGLVGVEWLALGFASGVAWPGSSPWAARLALWLLAGAFLVGFAQLLLSLLGVGFSNVPLVLLVAAFGALIVRFASRAQPATATAIDIERREALGWLLLGIILFAAAVRAFLVPEAGWDAFSHWGLKAQAFATSGTIVNAGTVHEYYPPLVPLLESWLLQHRGLVSIDLAKTVWALIGSAFAVCLAWQLRLTLRAHWLAPYFAAGIVLATTQLLEGFWTGQADLALTAYLTLATLAAWQWQRTPDRRWLVQLAVFGAAASLTKYEGLPRVGVVVVALAAVALLTRCRAHALPALVLGVATILAYAPWLAFRNSHAIAATAEHISQFQPAALGAVLLTVLAVLAGVRTGGAVLVAALAWLLSYRKLLAQRYVLFTLVVVGQLVATFVAFLISDTAPDVQASTSATRLIEQFLPVALFASAIWLAETTDLTAEA